MDKLQTLFGDKALTFSEFSAALGSSDIKLADLSEGGYVGKDKFDALQAKFDGLSGQLSEANKKLEGIDPEWKTKVAQAEQKAKDEVERIKFDYAVNAALSGAKAKNTKAVKALLDMNGLKLNGDEVVGLKEQIEKIKAENGYMFEGEKPEPSFGRPTPGMTAAAGSDDKKAQANAAIRAAFGKGN